MSYPDAPCRGCPDRWCADGKSCHSECDRYGEFVKRRNERYAWRKTQWEIDDYQAERRETIRRRLNLGKRW